MRMNIEQTKLLQGLDSWHNLYQTSTRLLRYDAWGILRLDLIYYKQFKQLHQQAARLLISGRNFLSIQ